MAFINEKTKEVNLKIIYFGPSASGKTASLRSIVQKMKEKGDGELVSVSGEDENVLYFDFVPLRLGKYKNYQLRVHLYAIPGEAAYPQARRLIAKGLDGVVFVADSAPERLEDNRKSLDNLKKLLEEEGEDFQTLPLVIQYNKRDLSKTVGVEDLRRLLNARHVPDFETAATQGTGVFEALKSVGKLAIKNLQRGES